MQRTWILCVVALLLLVSGADAAYTYTSWEHDLNMSVSAVDTNEYGTVTFIGTANTLYCYDLAGTETWNLTVNGTPQKIVSTQDGDRALLYTDNDIVYYVNGTDGDVVAEYQMAGVGRAKDVTMKKDGQVFAFAYENTTYVVDDVSSAVIGTPYSWYEIPVTTGTWHKLAYQATNDILALSKTGQSDVYMVNATAIPYHIPVTVKNNMTVTNISSVDIDDDITYLTVTSEPLFDFLHDESQKLEIWNNWSSVDGYSNTYPFEIVAWNTTNHTMELALFDFTLPHTNSTTLYFRNNVSRIYSVPSEVNIGLSFGTLSGARTTVVYDDFNDTVISEALWTPHETRSIGQMTEVDGSYTSIVGDYDEDDGMLVFTNSYSDLQYQPGMAGIYSNYVLNQRVTYTVNTTWSVGFDQWYGYGTGGFASAIANPSTVQFTNLTGLVTAPNTIWNNSVGTLAVGVNAGSYLYAYVNGAINQYSVTDTYPILPGSHVYTSDYEGYTTASYLRNVYYTTVSEYDLYHKQVTTYLCNSTGAAIYTFPTQSYGDADLDGFDGNLRVFLTGSSFSYNPYVQPPFYNHYGGIGWACLDTVEISIVMPEVETTAVGTYNPFAAPKKTVTGVIQYMDFPESGEWLAVAAATTSSPVNGYVHHIYVPASGFSTTYTAQTTGNSYDLKAADGCAFSIDAREITIEINRIDGTPVGTYTTGGSLTSVDIAMKNGLWAVAGSTDGKFYVFSKDATSGWYQDYASDSEESVTCVAMSWRGEMVVVGRSDGSVLMYPTGGGTEDDDDDTTDTTFPAQITVFQDGRLAVGKTVVIEKSETSNPYTWTAYATEQTDAQGKVVIPDADNGAFYKLTVDEKETVYAASSTSPQFTISVMTPIINGQWEFEAIYDDDTNIITGSYTDVEPAQSITIRIVNTNTKQLVAQQTVYGNNQLIVTVAGNPEHVYKVDVDAVRFTGNQIRMSKIVHTASIYNIPLGDLDVHMKNAIFTLIIMAVGGLFSYAHSTKGGLLLVVLAGGFAMFGFTTVSYAVIGIAGFVAIISILIRGTRR